MGEETVETAPHLSYMYTSLNTANLLSLFAKIHNSQCQIPQNTPLVSVIFWSFLV